jgi:hypothetical protein
MKQRKKNLPLNPSLSSNTSYPSALQALSKTVELNGKE